MTNKEALEKIKEMKVSLVNVVGFDGDFVDVIEKAVEKQIANKWRKVLGVVTPGGDPAYTCPNCGGGTHINGIESRKDWKYCPDCGARLEY